MQTLHSPHGLASLPPFTWEGMQPLTVVTGANGIGKSHLLLLIASALGGRTHPTNQLLGTVEVDGVQVMGRRPRLVGYLPAIWATGPAQASAAAMYGQVEPTVRAARRAARARRNAATSEPVTAMFAYLDDMSWLQAVDAARLDALGDRITHADILDMRGPYGFVIVDPADPIATLTRVFFAHASARVTHLLQGKPVAEIDALVGPPPWLRAAELLASFDVAFTIEAPIDVRFEYTLTCRLRSNDVVGPADLSSGERAILALVATIVVGETLAGGGGEPGGVLLLDEPDAHVHTSIIKDYIRHLERLVENGFQIIMVTHRPETMLLCPPDSLVEMRRDGDQLEFVPVPPPRRPALIARLAADTVAVLPTVRIVLVEDEDDRVFHEAACALALGFPGAGLPSHPPIAFMAAMAKPDEDGKQTARSTGDGGWTAVVARMKELRARDLQSVFRGLIDGDGKHGQPAPDVFRLERYSVESYWADPIGLYEWSVRRADGVGQGLAAAGGVSVPDLANLRTYDAIRLAPVVDAVVALLETKLPSALPRDRRDVLLHRQGGSVTLQYPAWLWTATKAELEAAVTAAFGNAVRVPWKTAPLVVGMIPADLIDIYRRLIVERL